MQGQAWSCIPFQRVDVCSNIMLGMASQESDRKEQDICFIMCLTDAGSPLHCALRPKHMLLTELMKSSQTTLSAPWYRVAQGQVLRLYVPIQDLGPASSML